MDLDKLYAILQETTCQFRKGEEVVESDAPGVHMTAIYAMPPESAARPELVKVDCHFVTVGVSMDKAEARRAELLDLLRAYPTPDRLAAGPSYIEVGGAIGDQGAALQLFALGSALKLWGVVTPESLGFSGDMARQMAGNGLVMITGFHDSLPPAVSP